MNLTTRYGNYIRPAFVVATILGLGFLLGYIAFAPKPADHTEFMPILRPDAADKAMWHLTVNDHLVCESSNGAVAVYCVLGHVYVARAYKQDNFYVFDKPNYTEDQWKKFRTNYKLHNRFADPCKLELLRYANQFSTMKEATIFAEANLPKDQKSNVYIYDKSQIWQIVDNAICVLKL